MSLSKIKKIKKKKNSSVQKRQFSDRILYLVLRSILKNLQVFIDELAYFYCR